MQNMRVCRHPAEEQSPDSTDERTSVNGYRDICSPPSPHLPSLLPFSSPSTPLLHSFLFILYIFFYFISRLVNHPSNSRIFRASTSDVSSLKSLLFIWSCDPERQTFSGKAIRAIRVHLARISNVSLSVLPGSPEPCPDSE